MEQREQPALAPVMYLAHEQWSPRYESTFFTVKMEAVELLSSAPSVDPSIRGKSNHPAYYYRVEVFCGHTSRAVFRRYSQFQWLYKQLPADNNRESVLVMPPGTCFCQPQDESFAQNRLEQLREFLRDALERPGYASHPSVVAFLELNAIAG
jgi:hypothetical protein